MKRVFKLVLLLMGFVCGAPLLCTAQVVPDSLNKDRYSLYYVCDRINIEEDYLDNAYQISRIKDILARSTRIDSIVIYAYASPEGAYHRNVWLSERRAEAARDFILQHLPATTVLHPDNIYLRPMAENWQGLDAELERNYHLPNRDRVMKIMRANIPTETKKWRLKKLDDGYTYNIIIRKHMPELRLATWICVYAPMPELGEVKPVVMEVRDTFFMPPPLQPMKPLKFEDPKERKTILALKTNLLYDALTLVNYSIEVPIGKQYSALFYHQFPWWRWGKANNEYCIRFLSIGGEGRWWFKPQPRLNPKDGRWRDKLVGHFLGVYAESGKWDFEFGRKICHQGEHWSAGLSYGFSKPISKRLNLEFSLSVGYASIAYRKFAPSNDYEILWRDPVKHGRWNYIGPTKAQISLVIPITVTTKRKGGDR